MDPELLHLGLELDAAAATALILEGRPTDADAHLEATGYRARLARWHEARLPARETLPRPLGG